MIAETLIIHAGDLIEWRDGSGYINKQPARVAPATLNISFSKAPGALRVFHKTNGTLLWHKNSAGPSKTVNNTHTDADLVAQPINTYAIEGVVSDPSGRYLPRTFSFTLGNSREHTVSLYHSPLGARFRKEGGIYGQIVFDDGLIATWALVQLTVTPSLGEPLEFVAQTDAHGEFSLPLERLPALTKDAPAQHYAAKIKVKALHSASKERPLDPDTLPTVKVAKGKTGNGKSQFVNTLDVAITPGTIARVVSPQHTLIVLKST